MKFMVCTNGHYMTSVDAESAAAAEHKILDLEGMNVIYGQRGVGVQAFAMSEMKDSYFQTLFESSTTISLRELARVLKRISDAKKEVEAIQQRKEDIENEIKRLQNLLNDVHGDLKAATTEYGIAVSM